jgi:hypothetical protein
MRRFASYSEHVKVLNQCLIIIMPLIQSSQHHPHNYHNYHNEVTLLLNDCNKQESLMSESVMTIRINFKPCKDNHLTTWHTWVMKTPRVATIHEVSKEMIWGLINSGRGYHLRSSEHDNKPFLDIPIQNSPLSPSCPAQSQISATIQPLHIYHIRPPSKERALSRAVSDHSASTDSLHN